MFFFNSILLEGPRNWQLGFQMPASPVMEGIMNFHHDVFFFMVIVVIFVSFLLYRVIEDYNSETNKIPLIVTHSANLEIIWTFIPALILVAIAIPSFSLLYSMDEVIQPLLTVKIIGHQWYWSYEFLDPYLNLGNFLDTTNNSRLSPVFKILNKNTNYLMNCYNTSLLESLKDTEINSSDLKSFSFNKDENLSLKKDMKKIRSDGNPVKNHLQTFLGLSEKSNSTKIRSYDSIMIPDDEIRFRHHRLLKVDNSLYLPVNANVRLIITSSDVLHSWAVPALGIKLDACPGRLNQTGTNLRRSGFFYGQCSEICGINHGFMPINVVGLNFSVDFDAPKNRSTNRIIWSLLDNLIDIKFNNN